MWWNEDKIRWYKAASEKTTFHKVLTNLLLPYLNKEAEIVELGCGLGYITNELNKLGYNAKGFDIDSDAIEFATRFFGNNYITQDCISDIPLSDIALAIFFGHFKDFDYLEKLLNSTKKLIIVSNLHSQFKTKRKTKLNEILNEQGLEYIQFSGEIPFNQPFKSYEDALSFISSYYPNNEEMVAGNLLKTEWGYQLNNNKHFIITIIDGRR